MDDMPESFGGVWYVVHDGLDILEIRALCCIVLIIYLCLCIVAVHFLCVILIIGILLLIIRRLY